MEKTRTITEMQSKQVIPVIRILFPVGVKGNELEKSINENRPAAIIKNTIIGIIICFRYLYRKLKFSVFILLKSENIA